MVSTVEQEKISYVHLWGESRTCYYYLLQVTENSLVVRFPETPNG